jgi:hypothetical protein
MLEAGELVGQRVRDVPEIEVVQVQHGPRVPAEPGRYNDGGVGGADPGDDGRSGRPSPAS